MKKIYLSLAAVILTSVSFSQSSLTSTDLNPVIGETFTINQGGYVDPGASGNNVTWDLSTLASTSNYAISIDAPNSNQPSTNMTFNYANQVYNYSNNDVNGQETYAQLASGVTISFSNPMKTVMFPINLSLNATDAFAANFTSQGFPFVRSGSSTFVCDGYGTLITPDRTINNVYRVKLNQVFSDVYSGGTINYSTESYAWYTAGFHCQIASVTTTTNDIQGTTQYGEYSNVGNLGVEMIKDDLISSYPNPVLNLLNLDLKENVSKIEIQNLNGQIEKEIIPLSTKLSVDMENLNSGMYLIIVYSENGNKSISKITKL